MNKLKWPHIHILLAIFIVACFNSTAIAEDSKKQQVQNEYGEIPSRWNEYFVLRDVVEEYKGESVRRVCYDDDLIKNAQKYQNLTIVRKENSQYFKMFAGGVDFTVISDSQILIQGEFTGKYLIETTRFSCSKNLPRAKYVLFTTDIGRGSFDRCLRRTKSLPILTRNRSGFKACEIRNIYQWNGPMDTRSLNTENSNENSNRWGQSKNQENQTAFVNVGAQKM